MEKILWDESFSVGSPELDDQHRRLIEMINSLAAHNPAPKDSAYVQNLVSRLSYYALFHFGREERLLERCGFPQLDAHKAEHEEFSRITVRIGHDAACGLVPLDELSRFLVRWWSHHILEVDMQYKPYLLILGDEAGTSDIQPLAEAHSLTPADREL